MRKISVQPTKIICIIPARAGSKGIPNKNIKPLLNKPLIAWSIETAKASKYIKRIVVSTDGNEIAKVSQGYDAEVVFRPASISGDKASAEDAITHVLDSLNENEGYVPDLVVFLQPTSPYRKAEDIDNAIELLTNEKYDSVFSASQEHFSGRWRKDNDGVVYPINFKPDERPNRQEYPIEYIENGSVYVFRPHVLKEFGARIGGRIGVYPMPALRSFQIDKKEDFNLLEKLLSVF